MLIQACLPGLLTTTHKTTTFAPTIDRGPTRLCYHACTVPAEVRRGPQDRTWYEPSNNHRPWRAAKAIARGRQADAGRTGLSAKGIGAIERGERRRLHPHTVRVLADALDLADAERDALFGAAPKRIGMAFVPPTALGGTVSVLPALHDTWSLLYGVLGLAGAAARKGNPQRASLRGGGGPA